MTPTRPNPKRGANGDTAAAWWPPSLGLRRWAAYTLMKTCLVVLGLLSIGFAAAAEEIGATGVWIVDRKSGEEPLRTGMVLPKSPADKAGIKPGMFLISVDGTNVVKKSTAEASSMVRGPVGVVVTLEVADAARTTTNKFKVKRGRAVIRDNRVVEISE